MTTAAQTRPVLVDTNVASYMLVRSGEQRALWSDQLLGRVLVIAVQTRVELLALPLTNNWERGRQIGSSKHSKGFP